MVTVACVLKSGGIYTERDVTRLHEAVHRNLAEPYRFVCLTDRPALGGVHCIPLRQDWPGWWSKLALFSPSTFEDNDRVLYLDLDTLILGDLSPLTAFAGKGPNGRLIVLRDFYRPLHYGSGVMAFRGGQLVGIYERFKKESATHIQKSGPFWGDQQVMEQYWPGALFWQDLVPAGTILSYKVHLMGQHNPPPECSIVCLHGKPKLGDIDVPWVNAYRDGVPA